MTIPTPLKPSLLQITAALSFLLSEVSSDDELLAKVLLNSVADPETQTKILELLPDFDTLNAKNIAEVFLSLANEDTENV